MKSYLFTTLLLLNLQAFAKAPSEFESAQTLWRDFRNCDSLIKDELKLINCVEPLLNSKITRYEKGKLVSILAMGFSFSDLHSCEGIKDLLPLRTVKDEKYFCMDVLGNTSKLPGFITVTIENKRFKLNAIKYNDKF